MVIFFALLICVAFYKVTENGHGKSLDLKNTMSIKGICAITVMFHHLGLFHFGYSDLPVAGMINYYFGVVPVGIFFMLSGYGLIVRYRTHGTKYLKRLISVKIPVLYAEFVSINLLYYLCLGGEFSDKGRVALSILGLDWFNRINPNSWYIYDILCVYLAFCVIFFICNRLGREKWAPIIMCVLAAAFQLTVILLGISSFNIYARALECLPLGMIYATYHDRLDRVLKKYAHGILLITSAILIIGLRYNTETILSAFVCISVIILSGKFSISNPITRFLGKISLWIYLLHGLFMTLLSPVTESRIPFTALTILCTILSATALEYMVRLICFTIAKLRKRRENAQ